MRIAAWFVVIFGATLLVLGLAGAVAGDITAALWLFGISLFFIVPGFLELKKGPNNRTTRELVIERPIDKHGTKREVRGGEFGAVVSSRKRFSRLQSPYLWISIVATLALIVLLMMFYNQQSEQLRLQNESILKQQSELDALRQSQQDQAAKQEAEKSATQAYVKSLEKKIAQQTPLPPSETTVEAAVKQWKPRMAFIYCEWRYTDTNQLYDAKSGSGTLERITWADGTTNDVVLTNRHVLLDTTGAFGPSLCLVSFPGASSILFTENQDVRTWATFDGGYIDLTRFDNAYVRQTAGGNISCAGDPVIGEKIVVLGYPGIGSQAGEITATQGIISGRDNPYWITDAKVEHGNSGGLAVSLKRNCALGIPTGAVAGTIESLARILDMHEILK